MKNQGFTLVELMVGIVISLLCILIALKFYSHVSKISITTTRDAQYDSQLTNGLGIAQKLMLNAGYGSGSAKDYKILPVNSISSLTQYVGNAVLWRSQASNNSYLCQGIADINGISASSNNKIIRRLVLLSATTCDNSGNLESFTWNIDQDLARIPIYKTTTDIDQTKANTPIYSFVEQSPPVSCSPYGLTTDGASTGLHPLIKINANSTMSALPTITKSVCLINIKL